MSAVGAFVFTILASLAFIAILWRMEEGSWPPVGIWWRIVLGRCVSCGRRRENHPRCIHCLTGVYYNWHTCHGCAKTQNFARLYGSSSRVVNYLIQKEAARIMMNKLSEEGGPLQAVDGLVDEIIVQLKEKEDNLG